MEYNNYYGEGNSPTINLGNISPDKISNNAMWYVVLLPALAIFLESFAISIYLGIILWSFVIIFGRYLCYKDYKMLKQKRHVRKHMGKCAIISPTAYLVMRCSLLKQSNFIAVICAVFVGYAFMGNGFTVSYTAYKNGGETFINSVESSYVANYDEFGNSSSTDNIETRLSQTLDDEVYSFSKTDSEIYIIVSGKLSDTLDCKYGGDTLEISFKLNHDGYNIKNLNVEISSVKINGTDATDSEKDEILKGIERRRI